MVDLPLAMSLEPRLLPLAITNGFEMSEKVRDRSITLGPEIPPSGPEPADNPNCSIATLSFGNCLRNHQRGGKRGGTTL